MSGKKKIWIDDGICSAFEYVYDDKGNRIVIFCKKRATHYAWYEQERVNKVLLCPLHIIKNIEYNDGTEYFDYKTNSLCTLEDIRGLL